MVEKKRKTCKTAVKRFKVTASGKIIRGRIGHGHLLAKKSSSHKRRLTTPVVVDKADTKRIKRVLGI